MTTKSVLAITIGMLCMSAIVQSSLIQVNTCSGINRAPLMPNVNISRVRHIILKQFTLFTLLVVCELLIIRHFELSFFTNKKQLLGTWYYFSQTPGLMNKTCNACFKQVISLKDACTIRVVESHVDK